MRTRIIALALAVGATTTAHAQSPWYASLQGGYSVSTSTAESFPGGGAFGSSAFIGRQLGSLLTLGAEGGVYGVENTTTVTDVDCPPPSVPGSRGCIETDRAELDWIQLGATLRIGPDKGSFRPYGAVGVGVYFGQRDTENTITDGTTGALLPDFPFSASTDRTAVGASIGGGLEWVPGSRDIWSVGISARLHALTGGDENGEYGGDTFVTLLAGVGYRW